MLIGFFLFLSLFTRQEFTATEVRDKHSYYLINDCDSIPILNREIIDYVESKLKTKVGSGQCWDFAEEALNLVNASWDGLYEFGRKVDLESECVYPGDIIQFEKVIIEYNKEGRKWRENMGHHTAIVYKVNSKGNFDLAHQNYGYSRKKVGITNLELKNITTGEFIIYRPTK